MGTTNLTEFEVAMKIVHKEPGWRLFGAARTRKLASLGLDENLVKTYINKIKNGELEEDPAKPDAPLPNPVIEETPVEEVKEEEQVIEEPKEEELVPIVEEPVTETTESEPIEVEAEPIIEEPATSGYVEEKKEEPNEEDNNGYPEGVVVYYVFKKGDTLAKVASMYNTTVARLLKKNNIKYPKQVTVGYRLKV
jgi:LysM repeat protein